MLSPIRKHHRNLDKKPLDFLDPRNAKNAKEAALIACGIKTSLEKQERRGKLVRHKVNYFPASSVIAQDNLEPHYSALVKVDNLAMQPYLFEDVAELDKQLFFSGLDKTCKFSYQICVDGKCLNFVRSYFKYATIQFTPEFFIDLLPEDFELMVWPQSKKQKSYNIHLPCTACFFDVGKSVLIGEKVIIVPQNFYLICVATDPRHKNNAAYYKIVEAEEFDSFFQPQKLPFSSSPNPL